MKKWSLENSTHPLLKYAMICRLWMKKPFWNKDFFTCKICGLRHMKLFLWMEEAETSKNTFQKRNIFPVFCGYSFFLEMKIELLQYFQTISCFKSILQYNSATQVVIWSRILTKMRGKRVAWKRSMEGKSWPPSFVSAKEICTKTRN